jgi:hypothetical protein
LLSALSCFHSWFPLVSLLQCRRVGEKVWNMLLLTSSVVGPNYFW